MSISRTLVILALATGPAVPSLAQPVATRVATVGEAPFTFRPTAEKDTLWTIVAATLPKDAPVTVNQAMVAILRQNPQAFVRGNLHMLRKGVVLTIPSLVQMQAEDDAKSSLVVTRHLRLLEERSTEHAALYALARVAPPPEPARPAASAVAPVPTLRPSASAPAAAASRSPAPAASAPVVRVPVPVVPPASVPATRASSPIVQPASAPASVPAPAPMASAPGMTPPAAVVPPPASAAATSASAAASSVAPPVPRPEATASAASAPAIALPASVPASSAVEPVASAPVAGPAASDIASAPSVAPEGGGVNYLPYLLGGAALLGAALWGWRRRQASPPQASGYVPPDLSQSSSAPRQAQASLAVLEAVRSVDAMKPVLDLVRRTDADTTSADSAEHIAAQATLKLQVARAYVELRRFDEAYVLLQFVAQHGSAEEQQEAQTLLRGSA